MIVIQTNNDNNVDDDDVRKKMENSSLCGNFSFFFIIVTPIYLIEEKQNGHGHVMRLCFFVFVFSWIHFVCVINHFTFHTTFYPFDIFFLYFGSMILIFMPR